ncbi:class I SAM-dependent methyltransferase [Actinoplanes cyaneus]|nr:class I SAM-dependent methyltransferase [Actinoplanes cyaneus]MCW2143164.1 Methyltransferase domain-containing protein [Actinoplanes cyaneus]
MTANRPTAAYFDTWYADMAVSPARDAIIARTLGLPPELEFAGTLPWQGIAAMIEALRLPPHGLLLDLACGRGGYGIEIARRTGAHLIGVDFSAVAVRAATAMSARLLPGGRTEFRLGTLTATGLPAGEADALMCVDAVQFAEPPLAALTEFRRLLAPGGRLALTCWEAVDDRAPARIREVDLRRDLPLAGFADVQVHDMPDWRAAERTMWEQALAADGTDAAVRSLQEEGRSSLAAFDALRRVFATATAP